MAEPICDFSLVCDKASTINNFIMLLLLEVNAFYELLLLPSVSSSTIIIVHPSQHIGTRKVIPSTVPNTCSALCLNLSLWSCLPPPPPNSSDSLPL